MAHFWSRIRRRPAFSAMIALFSAGITFALCVLYAGKAEAREQYQEIYRKIDVFCTVTNLAGDRSDRLDIQSGTIAHFTDGGDLAPLLEAVQIKGSSEIRWNGEVYTLAGITSLVIEPKLWPENGCTIFWKGNNQESFFAGQAMQCIIPRELEKKLVEAGVYGESFPLEIGSAQRHEQVFQGSLSIVGTYQGANDTIIYCPWQTYVAILQAVGRSKTADSLQATLRSNDQLPALREAASRYFAKPDAAFTGMDYVGELYLGLDINDLKLQQAEKTMQNSLHLNAVAVSLTFVFSMGTGIFISFLMVRSRRREIALMRTLGASNLRVYAEFALEQMIFVLLGVAAGGAGYMWTPAVWLVLFVCVYFAGLSGALFVMLRKKLLASMKEEE